MHLKRSCKAHKYSKTACVVWFVQLVAALGNVVQTDLELEFSVLKMSMIFTRVQETDEPLSYILSLLHVTVYDISVVM